MRVGGEKPQCYVLFVLSHGAAVDKEESVFGTDGKPLSKRRIKAELMDIDNLNRVPHILFFCCCRGSTYQCCYI